MRKDPPKYQKIDVYDGGTGEQLANCVPMLVPRKQRMSFEGGWFAMAQGPQTALARARKTLGADGYAVLHAMCARLDFENLIIVSQAEIARELEMQKQNVQRAIRRLIELEVMMEGPRIGVHRSYRMNPNFGWKGSAKNHRKALNERMEKAGLRIAAKDGQQTDLEDAIAKAKAKETGE